MVSKSDELPAQFNNLPEEFRLLQKKYDRQNIFTNASNDVRLESRLRSHKYKEEHQSEMIRDAKPQYLTKIDNNIELFREIENIIDQEMTHGMQAEMMKRSLIGAKTQNMEKSKSAGYLPTRKKKSRGDKKKLPSIKQRYGSGVVSSWRKGPIDMPKDRYFDLNDKSIYGNSTDPRARQLRQQTKLLMNSFQTSNKMANVNEVCRRRRIDDFKNKGEDHIVGKYDEIVASVEALERENDIEINDKELLEEIYQNIKYRKRKMKRKSSSRILELWDMLACPPCSKLAFKLQSELPLPADVLAAMSSPTKSSSGSNNPPSVTIISKLEDLADSVHAMNVFVLILRLWRERGYPDMYSSMGLLQPLIDICRAGGFEKCVKKSMEEMREWLARLCDELWRVTLIQLRFWAAYSQMSLDQHFTSFVENLHQEMCGFVAIFEEEKMIEDEKYNAKYSEKKVDKSREDVAQSTVINTVVVTDLAPDAANIVTTEVISSEGTDECEEEVESNVMKDKTVKYYTKNLSEKTQKIYQSLPPIVDSVNINKVTKNLLKEPNKILSKRLARHARVKAGLPADEEEDEK